jgi:hypothetical protein
MGDFDSDMYNETVNMHELLKEINKSMRELVTEIKGLRDDLKHGKA